MTKTWTSHVWQGLPVMLHWSASHEVMSVYMVQVLLMENNPCPELCEGVHCHSFQMIFSYISCLSCNSSILKSSTLNNFQFGSDSTTQSVFFSEDGGGGDFSHKLSNCRLAKTVHHHSKSRTLHQSLSGQRVCFWSTPHWHLAAI